MSTHIIEQDSSYAFSSTPPDGVLQILPLATYQNIITTCNYHMQDLEQATKRISRIMKLSAVLFIIGLIAWPLLALVFVWLLKELVPLFLVLIVVVPEILQIALFVTVLVWCLTQARKERIKVVKEMIGYFEKEKEGSLAGKGIEFFVKIKPSETGFVYSEKVYLEIVTQNGAEKIQSGEVKTEMQPENSYQGIEYINEQSNGYLALK